MIFSTDDVIIGSLLGDGCIKKPAKSKGAGANCWFSKSQCIRYDKYLLWHKEYVPYFRDISSYQYNAAYVVNKKVKTDKTIKRNGFVLESSANSFYTDLRNKWYPKGTKIVPYDIKLTLPMLAIWFCDDGYNVQGHRRAGICTQSFTYNECEFLADQINLLIGIRPHITPQRTTMIYAKQYFHFMDALSSLIVWDCMKYKCDTSKVPPLAYRSGENHHNSKLSWQVVSEIRLKTSNGCAKKDLAKNYGVSRRTISDIINNKTWIEAEKGLAEEAEKMESIL